MLRGRDERSEIFKVRWKGRMGKKDSWLDGSDERLEILKVRWKGWNIRNTQSYVERCEIRNPQG